MFIKNSKLIYAFFFFLLFIIKIKHVDKTAVQKKY
jgi:hypothetical protein